MVGVGAIGTLEIAQEFVFSKGTTFTMLWSASREAWEHYEMNSTSDFLLLDRSGNRLTEKTQPFDRILVGRLMADLLSLPLDEE